MEKTTEDQTTEEQNVPQEEPVKVNKWNLVELKNACDDHIQKYLTKKAQYHQHHTHTDIKLFLGYFSCIFALVGGTYTYWTPFQESKNVTLICVVAYMAINAIMVAYSFLIEREIIFVGHLESTKGTDAYHILTVHTSTNRYSDIYNITFEVHGGRNQSATETTIATNKYTISQSYGGWFDVNGLMDNEKFEKTLEEGLKATLSGEKPHKQ